MDTYARLLKILTDGGIDEEEAKQLASRYTTEAKTAVDHYYQLQAEQLQREGF